MDMLPTISATSDWHKPFRGFLSSITLIDNALEELILQFYEYDL